MSDKEILNLIKQIFIERMRIHPKFRALNHKLLWREIEKRISIPALQMPIQEPDKPAMKGITQMKYAALIGNLPVDLSGIQESIKRFYPNLSNADLRNISDELADSIAEALSSGGRRKFSSIPHVINSDDEIRRNLDMYLMIYSFVKHQWRHILATAKQYASTGADSFAISIDERPMLLFGGLPDLSSFWRLNKVTNRIDFRPINIYLGEWDSTKHERDPLEFEADLVESMWGGMRMQNAWLLVGFLPANDMPLLAIAEDPAIANAARERLESDRD